MKRGHGERSKDSLQKNLKDQLIQKFWKPSTSPWFYALLFLFTFANEKFLFTQTVKNLEWKEVEIEIIFPLPNNDSYF